MYIIIGAILGLLSVGFGAYVDHGLRGDVSPHILRALMTGARYNQLYGVVIVIIGFVRLTSHPLGDSKWLFVSGGLFTLGTLFFSLGIYFSVLFSMPALLHLAPIGGITLMLAWISLAIVGGRAVFCRKKGHS